MESMHKSAGTLFLYLGKDYPHIVLTNTYFSSKMDLQVQNPLILSYDLGVGT